jgi:hypothetical protein
MPEWRSEGNAEVDEKTGLAERHCRLHLVGDDRPKKLVVRQAKPWR